MEMVRAGLAGVVGILLAVSLKSFKAEYGVYVGIAICLVMLGCAARYMAGILETLEQLRSYLKDNYSYITVLLKAAGATYACEFCAGICRDAGYSGVAGQIEILGKLYILLAGMPILSALLESIRLLAV